MSLIRKGKSDPYVTVTLGAQQHKTHTINNELNPKWDYWCEVQNIILEIQIVYTPNILYNYCQCVVCLLFAQRTGIETQTL